LFFSKYYKLTDLFKIMKIKLVVNKMKMVIEDEN